MTHKQYKIKEETKMAVGKVTCTCSKCGKEIVLTKKFFKREDANNWEEYMKESNDFVCYECKKADEKEKMRQAMEEMEKDLELPKLEGSEKQVRWARELRYKFLKSFKTYRKKYEMVSLEDINSMVQAKFWIDHRNEGTYDIARNISDECKKVEYLNSNTAKEAISEMTMRPSIQEHEGTVEIKIVKNTVEAFFKKDEDFRKIVKSYGFVWDKDKTAWIKQCNEYTGTVYDRAAELINKLINKGFAVMCSNEDVKDKAIKADFIPETHKWVKHKKTSFVITWDRYKDDFYSKAKTLPGAEWNSSVRGMVIPNRNFREVLDFAEINHFSISKAAQQVIEVLEQCDERVVAEAPKELEISDKLKEILTSSREVLEDLKDDD